ILKSFIDGMTYPNSFFNKKCAMVGISSGIGGGGIAMSHLTDIFHYLGMHVLANKPKLAKIEENMSDNLLTNKFYIELLQIQAKMLIDFYKPNLHCHAKTYCFPVSHCHRLNYTWKY